MKNKGKTFRVFVNLPVDQSNQFFQQVHQLQEDPFVLQDPGHEIVKQNFTFMKI